MKEQTNFKVAIVGNPNAGKSSVFNQLTGLRQKVGNFPGVTVDKKLGVARLSERVEVTITDFPGTYSLYPTSQDERIAAAIFCQPQDINYPDAVLYVADVTFLERHLLLLTQVKDIGLPMVLALNMMDVAEREGLSYDLDLLSKKLDLPIVPISGRDGLNIDQLRAALEKLYWSQGEDTARLRAPFYRHNDQERAVAQAIQARMSQTFSAYQALLLAHHHQWLPLSVGDRQAIQAICADHRFESVRRQIAETMQRFDDFTPIVQEALQRRTSSTTPSLTDRIDDWLTHRFFGPVVFFGLMLLVFQAVFSWSAYPTDWIDGAFAWSGARLREVLPDGWLANLLVDGIWAGLGGIVIFVPQIAFLFLLLAVLEEIGYMARAVFLFDKLMQRFGLNGRSIVALVSGGACAIPAIMSTRTISNWKERLITILVTPFISCSARIPVYTLLIGLVVPSKPVLGFLNTQGLAFMGLYLLGVITALGAGWVLKQVLKTNESSFLMIELPEYRLPSWKNMLMTVKEKVVTFVTEAGKVILIISVLLWLLASFGPPKQMQHAAYLAEKEALVQKMDATATADLIASRQLEVSFAGYLGHWIEPAIRPLGFDWKIGIALITSFAAREVFVGTMATIYSIGSVEDETLVRKRIATEINPVTKQPVFNTATSASLLIFYVFAMQCMSTVAVVARETRSWKWALFQFLFMGLLAYGCSFLVFQWLS